jgi:hypothetical protein
MARWLLVEAMLVLRRHREEASMSVEIPPIGGPRAAFWRELRVALYLDAIESMTQLADQCGISTEEAYPLFERAKANTIRSVAEAFDQAVVIWRLEREMSGEDGDH